MHIPTVIEHLGGNRIFAMAFAHHFASAAGGVCLKIAPGLRATGRATHVRITLTARDTYDVEVCRFAKRATLSTVGGSQVVGYVEDVHADHLKRTVESMTGLRLSL